MTKLKKRIVSVAASLALTLNMATPVLADVTVTGNGADSKTEVNMTTGTSTMVQQSNNAMVTNTVMSTTNSGGNTADKNTSGDVVVWTGDAMSQVNVANTLNSNSAVVACCDADGVDVTVSGNGADSKNDVNVGDGEKKSPADILVNQANNAVVTNLVTADNSTGNNKANKNTNGDISVTSGDASSVIGISTVANKNSAFVGGLSGGDSDSSVVIEGNGADTKNNVDLEVGKDISVYQGNSAWVTNMVSTDNKTGKNDALKNTGGDVEILTGDVAVVAGISNKLNFNVADVNCCAVGGLDVLIKDNGADSINNVDAVVGGDVVIDQAESGGNKAMVMNTIFAGGKTGKNDANKNTNGEVGIMTGDVSVVAGIDNMLNFNYANVDCYVDDITVKVAGNGTDSKNEVNVETGADNGMWQGNMALLGNMVGPFGFTGNNDADENTGGSEGMDPLIYTGDAETVATVSNTGNVNEVGGTMPQVEFTFNLPTAQYWASFWSMLLWWGL